MNLVNVTVTLIQVRSEEMAGFGAGVRFLAGLALSSPLSIHGTVHGSVAELRPGLHCAPD